MTSGLNLALNFLPVAPDDFVFTAYRRPLAEGEASLPGTRFLPEDCAGGSATHAGRRRYQVVLNEEDGFEPVLVGAWTEHGLTADVIFQALQRRCTLADLRDDVELPERKLIRELDFVLSRHAGGAREVMRLRAHALHSRHQFGFFCSFALRVPDPTLIPERRRLELSLTQKNGRLNEDFYLDHNHKIEQFLRLFHARIARLTLHDGNPLDIEAKLSVVPTFTLSRRSYVFANKREGKSQFFGLRDHGPFQPARARSRLVFLFTREDRERSQHLYRALRGDLYSTFSGMDKLFRFPIGRENVSGIEVSAFDKGTLDQTCAALASEFPNDHIVPVALVPFSKHVSPEVTRLRTY